MPRRDRRIRPSDAPERARSYAFSNLQDVTWGNRPEEKPSTDLGIAPVKGDGVDVAVPSTDQDINAAYDDAVHVLANKPPPEVKTVNPEEKMNDSYRAIRTNASLCSPHHRHRFRTYR